MDFIDKLKPLATRIDTLLTKKVSEPRHFYLVGFILMFTGLPFILLFQFISYYLILSGLTLFVWGYAIDSYRFVKNIWASNTNKKILAALSGIIITLPAYISANHITNKITGLPPENFDSSVTVLSLFMTIKVSIIVGMCIFFITLLYHFFITIKQAMLGYIKIISSMVLFKDYKPEKDEKMHFAFPRIMGVCTFIFILGYLSDAYDDNQKNILPFFENIIVLTDYYEKSPCNNIVSKARVAFLNDGNISVAVQNKPFHWTFNKQNCDES